MYMIYQEDQTNPLRDGHYAEGECNIETTGRKDTLLWKRNQVYYLPEDHLNNSHIS